MTPDPARERRLQLRLGSAMMALLVLLVVGLTALGDRTLSRGYQVHADFADVQNLKEGAKVRVSGALIGRVLAVRRGLRPDEPRLRPGASKICARDEETASLEQRN